MVSGRCTCGRGGHQKTFGRRKIFLMIADDGAGGHDRDEHRSRGFLQFELPLHVLLLYAGQWSLVCLKIFLI